MERKIGEIFEYNGEWYQCKKSDPGIMDCCEGCSMTASECADFNCSDYERLDKTQVIFKKLEKVGEPFERDGYMYQEYKAHTYPLLMSGGAKIPTDNGFAVIIKQNKEDMGEKTIKIKKEDIKVGSKVIYLPSNRPYVITEANCRMKYDGDWHDCVIYTPLYDNPYKCFVRPIKDFAQNFVLDSAEEKEEKHSNLESTRKNLKPFNLEAAKAGKPVCTRDGRKARIICFNAKNERNIIALVQDAEFEGEENVVSYYPNGYLYDNDFDTSADLMMLPEKKEGWVNIYRDIDNNTPYTENDNIYSSRDKAKESAKMLNMKTYIDTIKVEWEE